ncbi:MAG: NAD(P)/FAD-dependent oxidoreductase [Congregibacter sp.]
MIKPPFDSRVTRRDVLHGLAALGAGALVPGTRLADAVEAMESLPASDYPPATTGMRGNHPGSWEYAHQLARTGRRQWGAAAHTDTTDFVLVIVGAGISGLAAAYFFQQDNPQAKILILDNHDDFGGHAKRNEFSVNGKTLLAYGGSQSMESPGAYSHEVKALLSDLSVDMPAFEKGFDQDFYRRNELQGGVFFNQRDWGETRMVKLDVGGLGDYLPLPKSELTTAEAIEQMPLSAGARQQLLRVMSETKDCMPDVPMDEKLDYLYEISYRDFLIKHLGVSEPEVFAVLEDLASDTGVGIDAAPAGDAIFYSVLPGRNATGLPTDQRSYEPYIHHFPDGNASVARLLVRRFIPGAARGSDMFDVVTSRFDYSKLDQPDQPVKIRLKSTVINVQHEGKPSRAKRVSVSYMRDGKLETASGSRVIMACYHSIIPSLCPELPQAQRNALSLQVKTPILYTNVALTNWRAWKEMGVGAFVAPGCYHINAMLDFPVTLGNYAFAQSPDDPVIVHMERFPHGKDAGMSTRERLRAGRRELLTTPFADMEASIREQLSEALGPGGFDAGRDIAGITVNRWAHGYSYGYGGLDDEAYDDWDDPRYPHMQARKKFGRIAIANSDADANAMMEAAIEQAHRAVKELS